MLETTWAWWGVLSTICLVHAALFAKHNVPRWHQLPRWASYTGATFVCCAFLRSFFPVNWSVRPHACLLDTPGRIIGGDMFDRFVAQSMELSIGYLMAHANANAAECMGLDRMAAVARLCFWPIAMAQCCCWRGEITDNKWWHVVEESLWGCGFAVHTILSVLALVASHLDDYSVGGTRALARRFYAKVVPLGALYCGYMFAVDIPMYFEQWRCAPGLEPAPMLCVVSPATNDSLGGPRTVPTRTRAPCTTSGATGSA